VTVFSYEFRLRMRVNVSLVTKAATRGRARADAPCQTKSYRPSLKPSIDFHLHIKTHSLRDNAEAG
jgi:hypothetical protein